MKRYLFIIAVFSWQQIFGQGFQKLYGGKNQESATIAVPAEGENIYFLGATTSDGAGDADISMVKIDKMGKKIWARTYGSTNWDAPTDMAKSQDGVAIIASSRSFSIDQSNNILFLKTDTAGAVLWSKIFSTGVNSNSGYLVSTHDGGYAFTGTARVNGLGKVLLIRTNSNGDTLFTRVYGSNTTDNVGIDIEQTADHGFIISGKSVVSNYSDALLIKTDSLGHIQWTKGYGSTKWEEGAAVKVTADNGFLVCGTTNGYGQGSYDILVMRLDAAGNVTWTKAYGGPELEAGYSIKEHPDKSIILSGYTSSFGYGHSMVGTSIPPDSYRVMGNDSINLFIMKLDALGDTIWAQSYGHGRQDEGFHFSDMPDGGFLMTGYSYSFNQSDSSQMMLVRTDSSGFSGCHERRFHPAMVDTMPVTNTLVFSEEVGLNVNTVTLQDAAWNVSEDDACLYYTAVSDPGPKVVISIYPNPANNAVYLNGVEDFSYEIFDLEGQLIWHGIGHQVIDVTDFRSGYYILHLIENNAVLKMVIVRE